MSWWHHQMETFSALLAICVGEFPAQRPVTLSFDVFFNRRPNKRLSKHLWGWWFETNLPPLWHHSNVTTTECHMVELVPSKWHTFFFNFTGKTGEIRAIPSWFLTHGSSWSCLTWWHHQMETFSVLLVLCVGNSGQIKCQQPGALMFSLICAWVNAWVNNREAGDLRCRRAHYDITVMI